MSCNQRVRSRRLVRLPAAAVGLALLLTSGVVRADLRDPRAWHVLVPQDAIVDLEVWGNLLAGADEGGGVLLLDPATGRRDLLTTRDGLTSNRVSDVAVDDAQRLWVATLGGGIVSFDTARDPDPITSLLDINVTSIAADGAFVFYGTEVGVGQIVSGQAGNTFTTDDGLVSDDVVAVAADAGTAWFGTPDGVSQFSRSENQFRTRNAGLDSPEALDIRDLHAGPQGVFAATRAGVFEFDAVQQQWVVPASGLNVAVRSLSVLGDDVLALGEDGVSYRLAPGATAWMATPLDLIDLELGAIVGGPDGVVWYGGSALDPTRIRNDRRAAFWHPGLAAPLRARGLVGSNCRGLAPDGQGGFWVGTFPVQGSVTHWRGDDDVVAYNFQDDPATADVTEGWLSNGIKFAIEPDRDGRLWVSEFTSGVTVVRNPDDDDPVASDYVHLTPDNSPLQARSVLRITEGPGREIWFAGNGGGSDVNLNQGIDILRDPRGDLFDPANWLKMTSSNSLLAGNEIKSVTFGLGAVWLSVADVGIQRFDFDGNSNQQITFDVLFDDAGSWETFPAADFGLSALNDPRDIRIAPDGAIWFGSNGQGVVRFRYDRNFGVIDVLRVQQTSFGPSLLSNQVRSIVVDRDGAVWAATDAGLNRITGASSADLRVDAWTDFAAFVTRGLPSSEVISPLPGSNMWTLAYDPAAHRLFMATQTGAAALDLARLAPPAPPGLTVQLYPNPVRDDRARVRVAGFTGIVDVSIYNMLGVLLATESDVQADDEIWDTRDILDNPVASGLYLVRVSRDGESTTQVLAVER